MTPRVIERLVGRHPAAADADIVEPAPATPGPDRTDRPRRPERADAMPDMTSGHAPAQGHMSARNDGVHIARGSTPERSPSDGPVATLPTAEDAIEFIAGVLRRNAPRLLAGAGRTAAERFAGLAVRRVAREMDTAVATIKGEVGRAAATIDAADRRALQDAMLAARLDRERAIIETAAVLGAGDLLAFVHDAAAARGPDSVDALRCREVVFGDAAPVAREAALDLVTDRPDHVRGARIRRAIAPVFRAAVTTARLPAGAIRCLDLVLDGTFDSDDRPIRTTPDPVSTATTRRGDEGSFALALAAGDADAAAIVLAHAAGCSPLAIRRAMHGRDAETLVSLVWRADFAADLAAPAQIVLGRIPPGLALQGHAPQDFPLATAAMASLCHALAR